MTAAQFEQVKAFVSTTEDYDHLHGCAVPVTPAGVPIGTYLIHTKQSKSIDYFINGENICESHYSVIHNIQLYKRKIGEKEIESLNITQ